MQDLECYERNHRQETTLQLKLLRVNSLNIFAIPFFSQSIATHTHRIYRNICYVNTLVNLLERRLKKSSVQLIPITKLSPVFLISYSKTLYSNNKTSEVNLLILFSQTHPSI